MLHAKGEKYNVYVANIKEHLENKTSQALLEELDQEFIAACHRGELIDIDLYDAYLDVLDEIDPIDDTPIDTLALFEQVQQKHPELFPESEPQAKTSPHPKFRAKRLLLVAAILITLLVLLAVGAYGTKTMTGFNSLGGDLFQIGYGSSSRLNLEQPAENGYNSLEEALADRGLTGIAPKWVPEDYSLQSIEVIGGSAYVNIAAGYTNGTDRIVIRILDYSVSELTDSSFERIDEYDEVYRVNSIDHFFMFNNERIQVTWENGSCLCNIMCSLSKEQLIRMIDSIYERDELS